VLIYQAPRREDVWGNGSIAALLTSVVDGGSQFAPLPLYSRGKQPLIEGWVDPRTSLDIMAKEKSLASAGNRTPTSRPAGQLARSLVCILTEPSRLTLRLFQMKEFRYLLTQDNSLMNLIFQFMWASGCKKFNLKYCCVHLYKPLCPRSVAVEFQEINLAR
jgi:hypothetical protein